MNGRIAKKIRKQTREEVRVASRKWYQQYYDGVKEMPFRARFELAWHIIFKR